MSLTNCFQIDDNKKSTSWADCCDDENEMPSFSILEKIQPKPEPKQLKLIKQEELFVEDKMPSNPFDLLNDSSDEEEIVREISSLTVQIDEDQYFDEEEESVSNEIQTDDQDGWKTVTKTSKGKKMISEGDEVLTCKRCKKDFLFTKDESDYFSSKGWPCRTKCKPCKQDMKFKDKFGSMPRVDRYKTINLN